MQDKNPFNAIEQYLKEYILKHGLNSLQDDAYTIYKEVIEKKLIDQSYAGALFVSLSIGIPSVIDNTKNDVDKLAKLLSEKCLLTSTVCVNLAEMYFSLFSQKNRDKYEKLNYFGFDEFCNSTWKFTSLAYGLWHAKDKRCFEYSLNVEVDLTIADKVKIDKGLAGLLQRNPLLSAEDIYKYYLRIFDNYIKKIFGRYLFFNDYYPPDYNPYNDIFEDDLDEFCQQYGFTMNESKFNIKPIDEN